jgi:G3E family GTPase
MHQKFGKFYRARLDSVVTVVDCDVLANKLVFEQQPGVGYGLTRSDTLCVWLIQQEGTGLSGALRQQILCADVVLLNKSDLVTSERYHETHTHTCTVSHWHSCLVDLLVRG